MEIFDYKKKFVRDARRVVVKIGSQILSSETGLARRRIGQLARDLALLHAQGRQVVVVSSGAVASGMTRLGRDRWPKALPHEQALAAVGQISLMALYEKCFGRFKRRVAQVLLTHEDLANRRRYLNAKHTLKTLLDWDIIPIVNENDTVAVEEMRFGDNDQLAALVATLLEADLLIILSDVDGVYDRDPRKEREARLIPLITDVKPIKRGLKDSAPGRFGRGGMFSKVCAAEQSGLSGIPTVIANGKKKGILDRIVDVQSVVGTLVIPPENRLASRKHWILYNVKPAGDVLVDEGAYDALVMRGKSLLPSGLRDVQGSFGVGQCVRCLDQSGREFARGLVNYDAQELRKIKGLHSSRIESVLGYKAYDEIIHRDDLVLLLPRPRTEPRPE